MSRSTGVFFFTITTICVMSACSPPIQPIAIERSRAALDPTDLPPPIRRTDPKTVEISLTAKEIASEIAPGWNAWVWTYNGTVPGPMIRVMEGDTVVLRLRNDPRSQEPHSIDLHAVTGPGGGGAITEVKPGEEKSLTFKATRQGTYIYHCAAEGMPWEHISYGMYGAIVVEPPGGLKPVDREFYVAQSEWYLKPVSGGGHSEGEEHEEYESSAKMEEAPSAPLPSDLYVLDEDAAFSERPTLFTFNGHLNALQNTALFGSRMRVEQGQRVRIFFVNAGPNLGSSFHVMGGIFDTVAPDHFSDTLRNVETWLVPPGSAATFEMTFPVPGSYMMVDHALFRAAKGARGTLHVDAKGQWPSDLYSPQPSSEHHP